MLPSLPLPKTLNTIVITVGEGKYMLWCWLAIAVGESACMTCPENEAMSINHLDLQLSLAAKLVPAV